jgi:hypothetical protein
MSQAPWHQGALSPEQFSSTNLPGSGQQVLGKQGQQGSSALCRA